MLENKVAPGTLTNACTIVIVVCTTTCSSSSSRGCCCSCSCCLLFYSLHFAGVFWRASVRGLSEHFDKQVNCTLGRWQRLSWHHQDEQVSFFGSF